jgi:hypothetical protein
MSDDTIAARHASKTPTAFSRRGVPSGERITAQTDGTIASEGWSQGISRFVYAI